MATSKPRKKKSSQLGVKRQYRSPNPITGLVTLDEVAEYIGLSRSTTNRLRREDPTFPKAHLLGARRLVFKRTEIENWMPGGGAQ